MQKVALCKYSPFSDLWGQIANMLRFDLGNRSRKWVAEMSICIFQITSFASLAFLCIFCASVYFPIPFDSNFEWPRRDISLGMMRAVSL